MVAGVIGPGEGPVTVQAVLPAGIHLAEVVSPAGQRRIAPAGPATLLVGLDVLVLAAVTGLIAGRKGTHAVPRADIVAQPLARAVPVGADVE